ncbi:MAG: VOC family protein [Candidatus Synoicihabitans palmerolidicus]|nr:VOC family protein [Candidatus Synoicihabitans palmerolidicus]
MIIPMLVCRDAAAELEFCQGGLDAQELSRRTDEHGNVVHATLQIGSELLMLHDESSHLASRAPAMDGSSSVVIYLYGPDVDAVMTQAIAAGARVILPAADQFWGDRVGRIMDLAGHVWNIAARINSDPV